MSLNVKKCKAIEWLAAGLRNKDVAEKLNVRPETLTRWHKIKEFEVALEARAAELLKIRNEKLQKLPTETLEYLDSVVKNEGETAFTRISAARIILQSTSGTRVRTESEIKLTGGDLDLTVYEGFKRRLLGEGEDAAS